LDERESENKKGKKVVKLVKRLGFKEGRFDEEGELFKMNYKPPMNAHRKQKSEPFTATTWLTDSIRRDVKVEFPVHKQNNSMHAVTTKLSSPEKRNEKTLTDANSSLKSPINSSMISQTSLRSPVEKKSSYGVQKLTP